MEQGIQKQPLRANRVKFQWHFIPSDTFKTLAIISRKAMFTLPGQQISQLHINYIIPIENTQAGKVMVKAACLFLELVRQ